jgi:hypothetical protein
MNKDDGEIEKRLSEFEKLAPDKPARFVRPARPVVDQGSDDDQPLFGGLFQ